MRNFTKPSLKLVQKTKPEKVYIKVYSKNWKDYFLMDRSNLGNVSTEVRRRYPNVMPIYYTIGS